MKKGNNPSSASLREMPEVDFSDAIPNPFAKYFARHGFCFVRRPQVVTSLADAPSRASLRAMPERDFSRGYRDPGRFAESLLQTGLNIRADARRARRRDV